MVHAAGKRLMEVELPDGLAGVHAAIVEHTIHRHVLPRLRHHLFRDVRHDYRGKAAKECFFCEVLVCVCVKNLSFCF